MNEVEKKKVFEYLVHDVFMVQHNLMLAEFLTDYGNLIKKNVEMSMLLGMQIEYPPLSLDLEIPIQKLVNNLMNIKTNFKSK